MGRRRRFELTRFVSSRFLVRPWFVVLISGYSFVQAFLDLTDIENREFRYVL